MPPKHHHAGHRSRLRARFFENPTVLPDHEVLELLLFYALPQKDTNEIAHKLLDRFGSLAGVLYAPLEQISTVEGLGEISATLFPVMKELFLRTQREVYRLKDSKKPAYDANVVGERFLSEFMGLEKEWVKVIGLNRSYQIIADVWVAEGTRDSANFVVSDVLEFAVRNHPYCVVLAHNHISGVGLPSISDFEATESIMKALNMMGIPLVDHLIFDGVGDFVSFAQSDDLMEARPAFSVCLQSPKENKSLTETMEAYRAFASEFVNKKQTNENKP